MTLEGHRTSVALEPEFWSVLETMAERRGQALTAIVAQVDSGRGDRPLASALRVYALRAASAR
jgi:predicted DNA-binding ribbon-helix-helix protein